MIYKKYLSYGSYQTAIWQLSNCQMAVIKLPYGSYQTAIWQLSNCPDRLNEELLLASCTEILFFMCEGNHLTGSNQTVSDEFPVLHYKLTVSNQTVSDEFPVLRYKLTGSNQTVSDEFPVLRYKLTVSNQTVSDEFPVLHYKLTVSNQTVSDEFPVLHYKFSSPHGVRNLAVFQRSMFQMCMCKFIGMIVRIKFIMILNDP